MADPVHPVYRDRHYRLAVAALLLCTPAMAGFLTLERGYVEVQKYLPGSYDPILASQASPYAFAQSEPNMGLNLGVDFALPGPLYWSNIVESITDQTQFRQIAYAFELGVRMQNLSLYLGHRSQHSLDSVTPDPFPRYFMLGARYQFFNKEK